MDDPVITPRKSPIQSQRKSSPPLSPLSDTGSPSFNPNEFNNYAFKSDIRRKNTMDDDDRINAHAIFQQLKQEKRNIIESVEKFLTTVDELDDFIFMLEHNRWISGKNGIIHFIPESPTSTDDTLNPPITPRKSVPLKSAHQETLADRGRAAHQETLTGRGRGKGRGGRRKIRI